MTSLPAPGLIEVSHVTKRYGKLVANHDLNLSVAAGQIAVLLGPNGAGKSTLIKSVCGLLRFEGTILIDGHDNHSVAAKRLLGYVPEFPAPYAMLTVAEHLEFIARAYGVRAWQADADALLRRFELDDKAMKLGKELSKGMQQKLSVCCALLPRPRAVVFDEPFVGLDPHGIRELKQAIADLRDQGCAVLVSTHIIDSIEQAWDTTYIMVQGRIAAVRRRDELADGTSLEETYFRVTEGRP
jgi:ABC-type multidrug transport system ATPase subunit